MGDGSDPPRADPWAADRQRMVREQIRARGIDDEGVLSAMRTVPRHLFVPEDLRDQAYQDKAITLGPEQSISQPYIVAMMTQLAAIHAGDRVLEIGTGSGYQAAVLAELTDRVYTIEIDREQSERAAETLRQLHYRAVRTRCGDGREGWPEAAPFDAILVTAAAARIPDTLRDQLAPGGRLVVPTGPSSGPQMLRVSVRDASGRWDENDAISVRFVPLL